MTTNDQKRELLIGCGSSRTKKMHKQNDPDWHNLTTLDVVASHKPDVVWDLNVLPYPFEDSSFDEIHAYEVLEHIGAQGDYKFFFAQFSEFWRILKPSGVLIATCPSRHSIWAYGDPSHTRILQKENLIFLSQPEYDQVGVTAMTDFREIYKADFQKIDANEDENYFMFVISAIKPSRIKENA